jgi:hypothetical protein
LGNNGDDEDDTNYYKSLMGILREVAELGKVDLACEDIQQCPSERSNGSIPKFKLVVDHRLRDSGGPRDGTWVTEMMPPVFTG